jgi:hypothetical protein
VLEIADCYREIELEFENYSERRRQNSLHKLDMLITALKVYARNSSGSSPSTTGASASTRS